jgi:agmatine deiminase
MTTSQISETGLTTNISSQYRMPAEWAPHAAVWLQWPDESMRDYPGYGVKLESTWLEMTRVMHEHVKVRIVVGSEPQRDRLQLQFRHFGFDSSNIEIFIIPHDDVWARDNGPIFFLDSAGNLVVTSWNFNGWGGRSPSARDTGVAKAAASMLGLPLITAPFIAEGGAMEVDGQGTFMATRSSILNANRNPELDLEEAEKVFRNLLGVEHFIWLSGAPPEVCEKLGDCTDYHIDIAARFTPNGAILYCDANDQSDARYPYLSRHCAELEGAVNAKGKSYDLIPLPTPKMYSTGIASIGIQNMSGASLKPGRLTDASYTNYLVTNGLVVVPVFGCAEDERAKAILAEHFPGRKVVGVPALSLNEEGGAIHCVTQQQPLV